MIGTAVLAQPRRGANVQTHESRVSVRHATAMEATSQPLNDGETISWGAIVDNLSAGGVGITLCYPFRLGTFLAIDLQRTSGQNRTMLARVVHVSDKADGTWYLGCEFIKPLTDSDVEMMI